MAIAPTNNLDKKLAELYMSKTTVNLDAESKITPEDFWNSMELIAINNKALMQVKRR